MRQGLERLACLVLMLACMLTPALAQTVTSVTVAEKAGVTTANYPMTVSIVFKQGDVASHVTAKVGSTNLTTQTDVKVRWTDNTVKHALVSFVIPSMPANGSVTVDFVSGGTNANSSYTTKAQLLATDFDARMTITPSGGTAATITARNLLNAIANPEYWIQGQVCSEFLIRDFAQNIANQLNVQYYVRYYPGWNGFRVDAVVENCWTEYRGNLTYDFNLLLGNSNPLSVFSKTAFAHTYNARWHKVFWQGTTPPAVEVRYNLAYLTSTKILPNYDTSLVVPAATIASEYTNWQASPHDIMQHGIVMTYFPTTGGRQEIGIHPAWTARYLLSMDNRMKEITLSCGDVSGSIPIHLREGNPAKSAKNHVMTIDDRPTVWASWWDYTYQDPADKLPAPIGTISSEWTVDNSHQASFACVPYLVTGDFYYLEEMYFWGGWDLADGNHAYRSDAQGLINDQTRGDAWAIRNVSDAATLAPDAQTLEKNYFTNKTNNNINNWVNRYITTGNYPSIHYWQDQSNIGADGGRPDGDLVTTCRYYTSPWMDDFVLIVLTHMKDVGWNTSGLVDWLGVSIINRFHHPDYNWYRGAPYHIPTAYNDGNNNGIRYTTWAAVNAAYVVQPGPTDFPSSDDVAGGYDYIARAALGGVVHLANGQTTWDWLTGSLHSNSDLNSTPTWAILPRGAVPPSDTTAPAAVSNLAAGSPTSASLTLTWTAPGDDNNTGTATSYDIRYSTSTINDTNWASATLVAGEPAPQIAGTGQSMVISGLNPNTTYYFAIKTADEVPNTSALSNVANGTTSPASGTLQVGPGKTYATVQAAIDAAADGSTIEIYTATYTQSAGWANVNKNSLTLRGMGTRPILDANGSCLSGKAIFIITGTGTTVENLEFKNARNTTDLNAAGIRQEAANLTVRNCYFHDNDDGILTNSGISGSTILIETSEFNHNGYGTGSSHNMYINPVDSLTIRYCYIHNANLGHEIKSRAAVNYILYNRIGNQGGNGSYEVQLANGGTSYVIGNQIEQSSTTGNPTIIDYGTEGSSADNHLYVVNNTIVNNKTSGTFVNNANATSALLQNNIFQGAGTVLVGAGTQTTNWTTTNAYLVDPVNFDFHLTAGSTGAINAGTSPGTGINGFNMNPTLQYVHPCTSQARPVSGTIDIGGYEYVSSTPTVQFAATSSSGAESTTSVNIPVTLSASYSGTVTVQYAVTGGTATGGGTDYTLAAGQLTFTSGVTSQNIPVTINNDALDEADETIIVTLSSPTNATLGANTTCTYTIIDDDAAPTVAFSAASSNGSEATTAVNLTVTLSAASGKTVTVNYAATGGTATGGTDYSISGTSLTFSPGTTSQNVPITVVNDTIPESNETIIVTLSGPTNAALGTNTTCTYTIIDDDAAPTVAFSAVSSSGSEATSPANLTVTLSAASSNTVTVNYAVTGGTATQGSDYTLPLGGNQVLALKRDAGLLQGGALSSQFASLTSTNVTTVTVKDAHVWGDGDAVYQNFGVRTQVPSGSGGAQGLIAWDLAAYAGGTVNKAELRFKCTMGNNLMQWATVKSHNWVEGNKDQNYPGVAPSVAGVTWANPSATNTSNSGPLGWGAASNAMLDATANGADLYAYSDFTSMPGGNAFVVADVTSAVQDWLSGAKSNYGLLVQVGNHDPYLSEAGTDNEPVLFLDVTLPQSKVTFAPGETSKTIPLTIINDTTGEYSETIIVTLSAPSNATLGTNTAHTYTIIDNDVLDCGATAETPVYGTVTGTYTNTQASDNVYESIKEVMNGTSYSWCEHKWTFNVRAGATIQFRVEAYRPSNTDTDNFQFAYSTNGTTWTNMVSITKTTDNNTDQTYSLPTSTSGTVYVRVRDTNRVSGKNSLDTVYIDRMVIRSNP